MRLSVVRHEIVVGWFIMAALLLGGVVLIVQTHSRGFLGGHTVRLTVDHGRGLRPGSQVLVQGIRVGEIEAIRLGEDNRVRVDCSILPQYAKNIRTDAVATVVEPPLLGESRVEITPGTAAEVAIPGQELNVKRQASFLDKLTNVEGRVDVVIKRVDTFVMSAVKTLDEFRRLVDRIDKSKGLAGKIIHDEALAKEAEETLKSLHRVSSRMETEGVDKLVAAVDEGRAAFADLRKADGRFQTMLKSADDTLLATKRAIEAAKVKETTASLRSAADALALASKSLSAAAGQAGPLTKDTQRAMAALQKASIAFQELSVQLARQPNSVIFGRTPERAPGVRR